MVGKILLEALFGEGSAGNKMDGVGDLNPFGEADEKADAATQAESAKKTNAPFLQGVGCFFGRSVWPAACGMAFLPVCRRPPARSLNL